MKNQMNETDLARQVVTWLQADQWTVYQEVKADYGRCDIYAVRGKASWAIEVKLSCSLKLIEQGCSWLGHANRTSIAVPRHGSFARELCHRLGLGLLQVSDVWVNQVEPARFIRTIAPPRLYPEQITYSEAGNAVSRFYSPFRGTCDRLTEWVRLNPGMPLSVAIKSIEHHYRNDSGARSSLSQWIREGKVKGVYMRVVGRAVALFPEPQEVVVTPELF